MYFHRAHAPGAHTVQFTSHPLSDLEIKSVMADLDYHSRDYRARGITEFQEILAKQPENVVANRGLGYEAMQKNDWDKASEHFKRAAAQDVKDPQVHYLLALMMSRKGMSSGNKENLDVIRKELTAAIALEPNYPDAYNLLGMTLSYAGEKQEAIDALQKAVALSPRNPWYTGNLANAYLQAQDLDHAIPLLQQLRMSSEPGIASMAAQQLQQVEAYRSAVSGHGGQSGNMQTAVQTVELNKVPDEAGNSTDSSQKRAGNTDSFRIERSSAVHEGCSCVSGLFRRACRYDHYFFRRKKMEDAGAAIEETGLDWSGRVFLLMDEP